MRHKKAIAYLLLQSIVIGNIIYYTERVNSVYKDNHFAQVSDYSSALFTEQEPEIRSSIRIFDEKSETAQEIDVYLWETYKKLGIYYKVSPNTIRILHGVYGDSVRYFKGSEIDVLQGEIERIRPEIERTLQYFRKNQEKERFISKELFNSFTEEVRNKLSLYEAILQTHREDTNSIWHTKIEKELQEISELPSESLLEQLDLTRAYERILVEKHSEERILFSDFTFKEKYKNILMEVLLEDEIELLGKAIAFDRTLYKTSEIADVQEKMILPYKVGEATYENLLLASTALVGKCRYAWGGGHGGTANISGINPIWKEVYQSYDPEDQISCLGRTYKSRNYPIFTVYSFDDLLRARGLTRTQVEEKELLRGRDNFTAGGVSTDLLDGLDCSGFISWSLNQVDTSRVYDTVAKSYATQYSSIQEIDPKEIQYKAKLQTGDLISTFTHVSMIVGEAPLGSNVYLHLESSTPCVKFGVSYFNNAKPNNIEIAKQIAQEANEVFGGIGHSPLNVVNLNNLFTRRADMQKILESSDIDFSTMTSDKNTEVCESTLTIVDELPKEETEAVIEPPEQKENLSLSVEHPLHTSDGESEAKEQETIEVATDIDGLTESALEGEYTIESENKESNKQESKGLSVPKVQKAIQKVVITPVYLQDLRIGRPKFFKNPYKHESAVTILQRVINETRSEYLTGRDTYSGKYFKLQENDSSLR